MQRDKVETVHKLLLWAAIISFSFGWGIAAAFGDTTVTKLSINGPSSVNEKTSSTYTAVATFSDGATQKVTSDAKWSENSSYATLSKGVLSAGSVSSNQSVTITASYYKDGVTKTANKTVTIVNVSGAKTLSGIAVTGPSSLNEG
ncbi:MAG TPA: hypothetical protein DCE18_13930, partial [Syntrophobacteraceae bacterium]|nr:hypothetical protein [Syntrophobacteraceae bacterium]